MKKIYLFLAVLFTSTALLAQVSLKLSPKDTFYVSNHPDSVFSIDAIIENTSAAAVDVTWERSILAAPQGWDFVVCDPVLCYAPLTKKAVFTLAAGEKGKVKLDAVPNSEAGSAWVRIAVTAKGLATPLIIKYAFNAKSKVAVNDVLASQISLSPNPVKDFFTLKNLDNRIESLQITDLTGKTLKKMNVSEGAVYDSNDLLKGTYFVSFLDKNSKRLATKKMIKVD